MTHSTARIDSNLNRLTKLAAELDISEQKLTVRNELLRAVMSQVPWGLIVCDKKGHFYVWNAEAENLIGPAPLEQSVKIFDNFALDYGLCDPDTNFEVFDVVSLPIVRALKGEIVNDEKIGIRTTGNLILVKCRAYPVRSKTGIVIGAVTIFER